jgi:cell division protein FtsQ
MLPFRKTNNIWLNRVIVITIISISAFCLIKVKNYFIYRSSFFQIQQFEIHGTKYLTQRDIIALSKVQMNDKLFEKNSNIIARNIRRSPYVKRATVERRLPSTLLIFIEEEEPIAFINAEGLKLVSENSVILPRAIESTLPDLPIINIAINRKYSDGDKITDASILKMLDYLKLIRVISVDLLAIISEITLSNGKPEFVLTNGACKLFISEENAKEELLNFRYFLDKKDNLDFLKDLEYIDLRYKDKVIVKDRNKG